MDHEIYRETLLRKKGTVPNRFGRVLLCGAAITLLLSGCGKSGLSLEEAIEKTAAYELETVPRADYGTLGGEWTVIALARSDAEVEDSYWEIYEANLEKAVKEAKGVLDEKRYTEYSRVILALRALGGNPADVGGYDLTVPLEDFDSVVEQGLNGAVYALLALDADGEAPDTELKEQYLTYILDAEKPGGGFSLSEKSEEAAADMTAMTLQCLAPYKERADVQEAIDRGVDVLAELQEEEGGYLSYGEFSCESLAQTMLALSTLGIDCNEEEEFQRDGKGLYDSLMEFYRKDGGFSHTKEGESDPMATDQALCALAAYKRFQDGKNTFYDMSDHR